MGFQSTFRFFFADEIFADEIFADEIFADEIFADEISAQTRPIQPGSAQHEKKLARKKFRPKARKFFRVRYGYKHERGWGGEDPPGQFFRFSKAYFSETPLINWSIDVSSTQQRGAGCD